MQQKRTEEKTYKCLQCPYAATRASILKRHMRIHSGEKSHKCPLCPYAAIRAGDLEEHIKKIHVDKYVSFRPPGILLRKEEDMGMNYIKRTHKRDKYSDQLDKELQN